MPEEMDLMISSVKTQMLLKVICGTTC